MHMTHVCCIAKMTKILSYKVCSNVKVWQDFLVCYAHSVHVLCTVSVPVKRETYFLRVAGRYCDCRCTRERRWRVRRKEVIKERE